MDQAPSSGSWPRWWLCVRIAGEGIEVRNPLRTVRVPWDEIEDVDSRGTLVITTRSGRVAAWAAPPNTRLGERRAEFVARARQWRNAGYVAPNGARRPDAEPDAAEIIRRVQAGRIRVATTGDAYEGVIRSWNFAVIVVSVVALAWSIASII